MDPYERWRQVLWMVSTVAIGVLTLAIVLTTVVVMFLGFAGSGSQPTTGY